MASTRPPCPWREAEVSEPGPEAAGAGGARRDCQDVGFASPCHRPGCEQEEAAAHPGRPHPGECPRREDGRVTLARVPSAREVTAAGQAEGRRRARPGAGAAGLSASPPPSPQPPEAAVRINKRGRGCGDPGPRNYVSRQAVRRVRGAWGRGGAGAALTKPLSAGGSEAAGARGPAGHKGRGVFASGSLGFTLRAPEASPRVLEGCGPAGCSHAGQNPHGVKGTVPKGTTVCPSGPARRVVQPSPPPPPRGSYKTHRESSCAVNVVTHARV